MAKSLNKSRMLISRLVLFVAMAIVLVSRQTFADETFWHELFDMVALFLLAICALGRTYTTAFLGGHKNQNLIDYGPFSVVRNPLYMFSLIGVTGVALMSNQWIVMIGLPIAFYFLYQALIKREEGFLKETFGPSYEAYCASVPRLIPNLGKYHAPDTATFAPKQLWHAARDALWWISPYLIFELIEVMQFRGWLPNLPF